jgi:hypothetical protein
LIAIVLIIIYGTNWAQKFKNILAKLGIIGTQIPAQATLVELEVIVDFTGGTKPLSIGAFLACASPERRLKYLTQTKPPKIVEVYISYKLKIS